MSYRHAKNMVVMFAGLVLLGPFSSATSPYDAKSEENRLKNAGMVMGEILAIPDDIPQDLLNKARCVIVMPSVLKAAFGVGGSYGRGAMVCRTGKNFTGPWGAPAMYALEAGSLMRTKVTLGADASVAAGPKGRSADADTDAYMRAEILSYSRARGVFAGVSLDGSTLRPDGRANRKLYGTNVKAAEIINGSEFTAPPAADNLITVLQNASPQLSR